MCTILHIMMHMFYRLTVFEIAPWHGYDSQVKSQVTDKTHRYAMCSFIVSRFLITPFPWSQPLWRYISIKTGQIWRGTGHVCLWQKYKIPKHILGAVHQISRWVRFDPNSGAFDFYVNLCHHECCSWMLCWGWTQFRFFLRVNSVTFYFLKLIHYGWNLIQFNCAVLKQYLAQWNMVLSLLHNASN